MDVMYWYWLVTVCTMVMCGYWLFVGYSVYKNADWYANKHKEDPEKYYAQGGKMVRWSFLGIILSPLWPIPLAFGLGYLAVLAGIWAKKFVVDIYYILTE